MKKGFTLIELLAVIIILAVIALIATPVVLNVVEEAKVKADRNSVYGLLDAAKLYYAESLLDTDKKAYTNGTTNVLDYLVISGEGPESGKIFINDKGQSALAVVYGKVCFTKKFNEYELKENDDIENCELDIEEIPVIPNEPQVSYKCIRATVLHTEECTHTDSTYYCSGAGYTASGSKGTTTITYGNLGTEGTLTSGDAFDCDVNGDGTYDATTERFYYVSDLYNTTSKTFDSNYAVLIYYNNTTKGVTDNKTSSIVAYNSNLNNSSAQNWFGPVTSIMNLPTTTQWKNVNLTNTSRAIINEANTGTTGGGTLPTSFSYAGYAARLITTQEITSTCGRAGSYSIGELNTCNYLMENTKFSSNSMDTNGFWVENPCASNSYNAWNIDGTSRFIDAYYVYSTDDTGVRPVIEVLKTDIDY